MKLMIRVALLAAMSGCSVPKLMLHEGFVPGYNKVYKESILPIATVGTKDSQVTLSNYYVQICDVQGNQASNCQTTLVLESINNYQVTRVLP